MYRVLSVIVHPNPNIEFSKDFTAQAIVATIKLLEKEYSHLNGDDYTVEKHTLYTTASYEAQNYIEAVRRIAKALKAIQDNFNKNCGNNYVSNTMHSISMLLQEMSIDRVFGFQEQVKCKLKPLAEIISSFYRNYLDEEKPESRYQLFVEHTNYKVSRALGEKFSFDKAYSAYKELFENGIDSESFQKLFATSTGYSIDEKGKTASINSMVRDVAKMIKDDPERLTFSETLLIDYVESQMLSHANGYMWFSNTGAFSDTNNVILEISYLLARIFDSLQSYFNGLFKETKEYKYRKTSNVFKEAIKEIHHAFYTVHKLQKKPMAYLNKV